MSSPSASTVEQSSLGVDRQVKYIDMKAFCDLKVICGDVEFRAHKAFLSRESDFFHKALAGDFMEAQENVINLTEEQPDLLEQMLRYAYIRDYLSLEPPEGMVKSVFDAKVYALADKYQMKSLRSDIVPVFQNNILEQWKQNSFTEVIDEVYSSTPDSDRQLRDPVVLEMVAHFHEISKDAAVLNCLKSQPSFAADLVEALHQTALERKRKYKCQCGTIFEAVIALSRSDLYQCPVCKQSASSVQWLDRETR